MDFEEHCINGLAFSSLASARSSNARASHFSSLAALAPRNVIILPKKKEKKSRSGAGARRR